MRMLATRYAGKAQPALAKKDRAQIAHVLPPLNGLSLATQFSKSLTEAEMHTATILSNFVVEDNCIKCRSGYRKLTTRGTAPVWNLLPWYGAVNKLLAASNHELWDAQNGALVKGGFTSDDWHWTAFSNLAQVDFTVAVNGADGVWSWNGGLTAADVVKETVTAPSAEAWILPNKFHIVLAHMNRLFFADRDNLAVYYLPIQQKAGEVKVLPLNAVFRRGGTIRAVSTWTVDSGAGMDDLLVIFSSNGECVIYKGTDPDTDFSLAGIFRFDSPMSKHSITQYGGELYVLISTGLVPLSTMLRAESDHLGQSERNVTTLFLRASIANRSVEGWQTFLNPSTGRLFCNVPLGAPNRYQQFIRHMPKSVWSTFDDIPARCWSWLDPNVYFGDDTGSTYEMHPRYLNDNGNPIRVDVQTSWDDFKSSGDKHFKVVKAYISTNGDIHPWIDMKVDFDYSPAENIPDIGSTSIGPSWDATLWDTELWGAGERALALWNGVKPIGNVGAVRMTARINSSTLSVNGWDVLFEQGAFGT